MFENAPPEPGGTTPPIIVCWLLTLPGALTFACSGRSFWWNHCGRLSHTVYVQEGLTAVGNCLKGAQHVPKPYFHEGICVTLT